MRFSWAALFIVSTAIGFAMLPCRAAAGQDAAAVSNPQEAAERDEEARRFFTDLKVITHKGEALRFYSDILKDRLVVISFFYTNCPTAQPALLTLFKLQKRLGPQLGRDVLLLSLSVDPGKDTPEVIWDYVKKFNPQDGWLFLTGSEGNMDTINRRLGNTLRLPEGHLRQFLLGNLKTGHWMRMLESAPVIALAEGLRNLETEE